MFYGIICGFSAALINSAGYLFSARFLLHHKSPIRLLVMSSLMMLTMAVPFTLILFPFGMVPDPGRYFLQAVLTGMLFLLGQGAFFGAMRYFEASRLSSLLGLKIIVLSLIFFGAGGSLNWMQISAVLIATAAAMIFNWSGLEKSSVKGWLLLLVTLCCYSLVDMLETNLVVKMHAYTGWSRLHSAIAVVPFLYSVIGVLMLPALFRFRPDRDQLAKAFPYAVLWLASQVLLLCCFSFLQPVFGNVILATRGILSVIAGAALPWFGLAALDSKIPLRLWIRRTIAALMMLGAIALYSFGSM